MNLKNKIISKFIKEGHTYEYEYGEIHEGLIKDHELTADQQRLYSYYVPIVIDSQIAYINKINSGWRRYWTAENLGWSVRFITSNKGTFKNLYDNPFGDQ